MLALCLSLYCRIDLVWLSALPLVKRWLLLFKRGVVHSKFILPKFSMEVPDWSHLCIIFYHHAILYLNKYWIFIAFFSLFSGPMFNGEEGLRIMNFEELKN